MAPKRTLELAELYRIQVRELPTYAMYTLDTEGYLTSWNLGVERLLGYSEDEWVGQHGGIIFTPADKGVEMCLSEMRLARETGSAADIRWHRHKSGAEFFANGFMHPIFDSGGNLLGYSKIMSDETTRKRLQDALTESNAALEQFAFVASHDLQEPLRTMNAYSQLLAEKYRGKLDPETDLFLDFLTNGSARLNALVRDLLDFARITSENERPTSAALDEDLEAALSHLAQAIKESNATITHDPMPSLQVDRGQMVRLFQNLIGNALKYRNPGRPTNIHIRAEHRGAEWRFSVTDNGIGFDPAHAGKIFAPFKRLHHGDQYPGTGVGLAICQRIVQAHGGQIWADSAPDQGSVFTFTLPDTRLAEQRKTANPDNGQSIGSASQ